MLFGLHGGIIITLSFKFENGKGAQFRNQLNVLLYVILSNRICE